MLEMDLHCRVRCVAKVCGYSIISKVTKMPARLFTIPEILAMLRLRDFIDSTWRVVCSIIYGDLYQAYGLNDIDR